MKYSQNMQIPIFPCPALVRHKYRNIDTGKFIGAATAPYRIKMLHRTCKFVSNFPCSN